MSKPRLLVLTSTFPRWRGDTDPRFVYDLCRMLAREFAVTVLAPHCAGAARTEEVDGLTVRRFRYAPARLEKLAYDGGIAARLGRAPAYWLLVPALLLGQLVAAVRLLRREDFDVVHAHWLIPQGVVAVAARSLARRSPRLVCTSHGSDLYGFNGRLGKLAKRYAVAGADHVAVVSRPMVAAIRRLGGDVPVSVAPMGVDLRSRFTVDESVARDPDQMLYIGRLVEGKGLGPLLDAMPRIVARYPGMKLLLVGDGQKREELRRIVDRLGLEGRVVFMGSRRHDQLPDLLRRAGVAALPFGRDEGLGLTAIEALGCGCPVVVGDAPAVDDIVERDVTGFVVDPRDVEALIRAISAVRDDPSRALAMAREGRRRVAARYDWAVVGGHYAKLLRGATVKTCGGTVG